MNRRTREGSTPVYDSVRTAAVEGIPFATSYPPHHPDIYRQLCAEIGHDPCKSAYGAHAGHAFSWWPSQLAFG